MVSDAPPGLTWNARNVPRHSVTLPLSSRTTRPFDFANPEVTSTNSIIYDASRNAEPVPIHSPSTLTSSPSTHDNQKAPSLTLDLCLRDSPPEWEVLPLPSWPNSHHDLNTGGSDRPQQSTAASGPPPPITVDLDDDVEMCDDWPSAEEMDIIEATFPTSPPYPPPDPEVERLVRFGMHSHFPLTVSCLNPLRNLPQDSPWRSLFAIQERVDVDWNDRCSERYRQRPCSNRRRSECDWARRVSHCADCRRDSLVKRLLTEQFSKRLNASFW